MKSTVIVASAVILQVVRGNEIITRNEQPKLILQRNMQATVPEGGSCPTMNPPFPLPPDNSNCWQWWTPPPDGVMKPDMSAPPTGCDYEPCQDAVCACDDYCCNVAWDLSCRGYYVQSADSEENNYFVPGCSAKLLCCEPESAFPDPPVGGAMPGNAVTILSPTVTTELETSYQCTPGTPGCCETMIPPSFLPPDDSTCWQWWDPPGDGILPPGSLPPPKGCNYEPCQAAVCACDSYCCDSAWDLSCRGYYVQSGDSDENNYFVPGCSAKMLCCEPESAFPDPPIGGAMPENAVNVILAPTVTIELETSSQCDPGTPGCCNTMIPPSFLPPDDSTCWQWWDPPADGVMSLGAASPPKGCNYKPCQDAVCACDSYCCDTAWDLSCRGYDGAQGDSTENNYFVDNCSAKILCCEPESAFPDPPIGGAMPENAVNVILAPTVTIELETSSQCDPGTPGCCNTMIPPSFLPPDDSTCWQWWDPPADGVMSLGAASPPKGCNYKPCQDAVCACDSYCCDTAWDLSCRGYEGAQGDSTENNFFVDNCSAKILCCEPESAFPDPPVGGATDILTGPTIQIISAPSAVVIVPAPDSPIQVPVPVGMEIVVDPVPAPATTVIMPISVPVPVAPKIIEVPVPSPATPVIIPVSVSVPVAPKIIEVPVPSPGTPVIIPVPLPVPVAPKIIQVPVPAPGTPVIIPVPVPVPVAPKIIQVPVPAPVTPVIIPVLVPVPVPVTPVIIPVPLPVPVPSVKYIPVPVPVPIVKQVPLPVPVPVTVIKYIPVPVTQVKVVPLPVPVPLPTPVVYVPVPVPAPGPASTDIGISVNSNSVEVQGAKEPKPSSVSITIPVTETTVIKEKNKVQVQNTCVCPSLPEVSSVTSVTYISSIDTSKSKSGKSKSGKSGKSKSGKSGKSGNRRLSSKSSKSTKAYSVEKKTTTNNEKGFYVLSEGCNCPCFCPSQISAQNDFVSSETSSKSKSGKSGSKSKSGKSGSKSKSGKSGKSGRRLSSSKCSGKSKGSKSSDSGCSESTTIATVSTVSTYNNACICNNAGHPFIQTVHASTSESGKSEEKKSNAGHPFIQAVHASTSESGKSKEKKSGSRRDLR